MKKVIFVLVLCSSAMAQNYLVSTVAGNGIQGNMDSTAQDCQLYWPYGAVSDNDSLIFFSDAGNHSIKKINLISGVVKTIAGTGVIGFHDGVGDSATFNWPDALFYKNGILYISDNQNNAVRKMDLATNMVSTIAGTGVLGYLDGPASQAQFMNTNGLVVDSLDDIYVADPFNYCIRKISGGQVTTFAGMPGVQGYNDGPASQALFNRPRYVCLDSNGVMFVTDIMNNVIRKIANGIVTTFAGTGAPGGADGADSVATFHAPVGIASTFNNYLYVVDGGGNKLRKIDPQGNVSTIAGDGNFGFNDGADSTAEFYYPQAVCYDEHGIIYMADRNNNRIRKIDLPYSEAKIHGSAGVPSVVIPKGLNIYPNPTNGLVSIDGVNRNKSLTYKIINLVGIEVKSGMLKSSENNINIQDLPSGMYTIIVSQKDKTASTKISLQR